MKRAGYEGTGGYEGGEVIEREDEKGEAKAGEHLGGLGWDLGNGVRNECAFGF